jgi:hypothetical protein
MKFELKNVSKLQAAKVSAVLYLVLGIPLALIMLVPAMFTHAPISWLMIVLMPVLYAVAGFVFTFLAAWIYNGVAGMVGGLEYTMVQVEQQ